MCARMLVKCVEVLRLRVSRVSMQLMRERQLRATRRCGQERVRGLL
jgi:hypothetical protein